MPFIVMPVSNILAGKALVDARTVVTSAIAFPMALTHAILKQRSLLDIDRLVRWGLVYTMLGIDNRGSPLHFGGRRIGWPVRNSHILGSLAHRPGLCRSRRLPRCSLEEQAANPGRAPLLAVGARWTKASFWDIIGLPQITLLILIASLGTSSLYSPFWSNGQSALSIDDLDANTSRSVQMLSRKTAKTLAEVFHAKFEGRERVDTLQGWKTLYRLGKDWLYDFLYEHDYDAWFLNSAKALRTSDKRALKEFIMRLHTGETVASATPDWTWQQRFKLGQRLLRDLAEDVLVWAQGPQTYVGDSVKRKLPKLISELELDGYIFP